LKIKIIINKQWIADAAGGPLPEFIGRSAGD
jgi:hypothetical protein